VGECVWVPGRVGVCEHVALLIQHETRMRNTVPSFMAPLAPTLSHKSHDFRGKKLLNIKCVLIFSISFV
jgi:hypothetical protein